MAAKRGRGRPPDLKRRRLAAKLRAQQALAREVGDWNEMIGAFAGRMKDLHATALEAAIFDFLNFEHLEAKGRARHTKSDE